MLTVSADCDRSSSAKFGAVKHAEPHSTPVCPGRKHSRARNNVLFLLQARHSEPVLTLASRQRSEVHLISLGIGQERLIL